MPLQQQEWYWGSRSVQNRLQDSVKPDGSFLVYDSEVEGEYELCAQKDGLNGFVHISYFNDTYGFFDYSCCPPRAFFKFPTVPAFIEHFKQASLKIRTADNVYLEVTLTDPISKIGRVSDPPVPFPPPFFPCTSSSLPHSILLHPWSIFQLFLRSKQATGCAKLLILIGAHTLNLT